MKDLIGPTPEEVIKENSGQIKDNFLMKQILRSRLGKVTLAFLSLTGASQLGPQFFPDVLFKSVTQVAGQTERYVSHLPLISNIYPDIPPEFSAQQKENLPQFENKVGWVYTAVPGASKEQMIEDIKRMKDLGANIVYIGHNNPGDANPNKTEPGLSYAVYYSTKNNTASAEGAHLMYGAIVNALEASKEVGIDVVLPAGYQIQMGPEWNSSHQEDLRRNPDGGPMNHWGSGETASPYSPKYRQDIQEYYQWVNDNIVTKYPNIVAVNLADEPMGSDFSNYAKEEFAKRYGVPFDQADSYIKGEFLSGMLADYAAFSANLWKQINPNIWTMMTFHIQRDAPFFPNFEKIFADTPDTFIFSADTHLFDAPSNQPTTQREINLLYAQVRTLSWLSHVYHKPLMLWTSANDWGLSNQGGIQEAQLNLDIVHNVGKQLGGRLGMIMAWGWNIGGQGVYRDEGTFSRVNDEDIINTLSGALAERRDNLSSVTLGTPEVIFYLPAGTLYPWIGQHDSSHIAPVGGNIDNHDFTSRYYIYLTDGEALNRARAAGSQIITISP